MVQTNNEEIGNLAKPRRVSLQGIISVVALLVKAISIHCEARLGYDALETYRISPRLYRASLRVITLEKGIGHFENNTKYLPLDVGLLQENKEREKEKLPFTGYSQIFYSDWYLQCVVLSKEDNQRQSKIMYKDFKQSESLDTGFVGGSGIIWMFSGIVLGLLAGLGMYYFSNSSSSSLSTADTVQQKIEAAQKGQATQLSKPVASKTQPVSYQKTAAQKTEQRQNKFSYYAVLPTLDVPVSTARPVETREEVLAGVSESTIENQVVEKTVEKKAPRSAAVEDQVISDTQSGDYLLQVASFKKKSKANLTKGRLTKRGVSAYVQSKKVKGRLWYRVLAGPVDQNSVDNWKQTAERLGHHPLIISVR